MAGKRHHYLPQLLLRRFAARREPGRGRVWRGDLHQDRLLAVAPRHEAAKRHYYRLPAELEIPGMSPEDVLQRVETAAGAAIVKFERHRRVDVVDRHMLAMFLHLQHRRTPAGRRQLRFMDEFFAKLDFELRVSDGRRVRKALSKGRRRPSRAEVEQYQRKTLDDLHSGQLVVESTPEREVALMFLHVDTIAPTLVEAFDWRFLVIPEAAGEAVLPDVGVTLFDPQPKLQQSGTGFRSSAESETVLHLAPNLVLLLRPGSGYGDWQEATAAQVEQINMRAVACSDRCIYGSSRELVESVLGLAAADPDRVALLRPTPPTMWIAEGQGEPKPGPKMFTGYSSAGTVTQELFVEPEGIEYARKHAVRVGTRRGLRARVSNVAAALRSH